MATTFENREGKLVDGTAKASGLLTALISWIGGFAASKEYAPALTMSASEQDALMRIVVAVIGGCFGLAGTALAVLLKHWLDTRKKKREQE